MKKFFLKIKNNFSNKILNKRRVYLDYAGATPISEIAKKSLIENLSFFGNASAIYKEGVLAKNVLNNSRKIISQLLNCYHYEIYFTSSGTESANLAISGVINYYNSVKKDKNILPHVITTNIEHPAVLETIKNFEYKKEIEVTYLKVNSEGLINLKDVREALKENTILVSIMYVNNEIGTILPIKEIGRIIEVYKREKNTKIVGKENDKNVDLKSFYPYFYTDACQAANYCVLDVRSLRVDMMTLNSSKVYGPKGVAMLYKKENVLILPISFGGGQERGLRSGTEAVPLIASFSSALKDVRDIKGEYGEGKELDRVRRLQKILIEELKKEIKDIIIYGSLKEDERVPNNVNCRIPRLSSEEVIIRLDTKGFAVSHKSACASEKESGSYVILALGEKEEATRENIRITIGRYTSEKDVLNLVKEMKMIALKYRQ